MRIVQICLYYWPVVGGVETVVQNWSETLVKRGHNVTVLCLPWGPDGVKSGLPDESLNGVNIIRRNLKKIIRTLLFRPFDVIHAHSFPTSLTLVAWFIAFIRRKKFFISGHYSPDDLNSFKDRYGNFKTFLYKNILTSKLTYCPVSSMESEGVQVLFGVPVKQQLCIPNGVHLHEFISKEKQPHSISRLFFLGRIDPSKGIEILIEAYSKLSKIYHNLELTICGPVHNEEYYRNLLKMSEDLDGIEWIQIDRKQILNTLCEQDVLVLPSRGEVFGIVLIEAMAAGLIPVASDGGGLSETLGNGKFGFLFKNGSVDSLTEVIKDILALDVKERESIMKANFVHVQKFDWFEVVNKLEKCYQDALCE